MAISKKSYEEALKVFERFEGEDYNSLTESQQYALKSATLLIKMYLDEQRRK